MPGRTQTSVAGEVGLLPALEPCFTDARFRATRRGGRTSCTKYTPLPTSEAHTSCASARSVEPAPPCWRPRGLRPAPRPAPGVALGRARWSGWSRRRAPFQSPLNPLPSRYSASGPESRSALPFPDGRPLVAIADTSRPARRMPSGTTLWRRSILASVNDLFGGRHPCRPPASVDATHRARGGPVARAQALERLAASPVRVRARPVVGRRQPTVAGAPAQHGVEHALPSPAPLGRAGVARLAVRVGVALAVARLRVRAAAAAHALMTGLDRACLLAGGVLRRSKGR